MLGGGGGRQEKNIDTHNPWVAPLGIGHKSTSILKKKKTGGEEDGEGGTNYKAESNQDWDRGGMENRPVPWTAIKPR